MAEPRTKPWKIESEAQNLVLFALITDGPNRLTWAQWRTVEAMERLGLIVKIRTRHKVTELGLACYELTREYGRLARQRRPTAGRRSGEEAP